MFVGYRYQKMNLSWLVTHDLPLLDGGNILCICMDLWLKKLKPDYIFKGFFLFVWLAVFRELEKPTWLACCCGCWIIRDNLRSTFFCVKNNIWVWICFDFLKPWSWNPFSLYSPWRSKEIRVKYWVTQCVETKVKHF